MNKINRVCQNCTKSFLASNADVNKGWAKFCSKDCKYKAMRKPKLNYLCIVCGDSFQKYQSRIKYDANKFCGRKCQKKYQTGENHPMFKGGNITPDGYRRIYVNKKLIREHRHVMQEHINRRLTKDEHIHHLDGDKLNNTIENLIIVSNAEHQATYHPKDLTALRLAKRAKKGQ